MPNQNSIVNANDWRTASRKARAASAEPLTLPSGAIILAARPAPMEWILAGRVPQRLLAAALDESDHPRDGRRRARLPSANAGNGDPASASRSRGKRFKQPDVAMTREDVLDLARFAAHIVRASVVRPAIGDGPGEIALDEIPLEDRAFIFEWACRAADTAGAIPAKEDAASPSVDGLERFRAQRELSPAGRHGAEVRLPAEPTGGVA